MAKTASSTLKINLYQNDHLKNMNILPIKSMCIWLTGLSGCGKTTIAKALQKKLRELNIISAIIDGDEVRKFISRDLKFSKEDRLENARRIANIAKLIYQNNIISIVSTISPYKESRDFARSCFPENAFIEIYVSTPIEICRQRDPKLLYTAVDMGQVGNMTGIDMPYEESDYVDIEIDTQILDINDSVQKIINYLNSMK